MGILVFLLNDFLQSGQAVMRISGLFIISSFNVFTLTVFFSALLNIMFPRLPPQHKAFSFSNFIVVSSTALFNSFRGSS